MAVCMKEFGNPTKNVELENSQINKDKFSMEFGVMIDFSVRKLKRNTRK